MAENTHAEFAGLITPPGELAYQNSATRVVCKPNAVNELDSEIATLGCSRIMIICGPNTARSSLFSRIRDKLAGITVLVRIDVVEHSSTVNVTTAAAEARERNIDGIVAIGGGSSSDTAKGIAILLAEGGRIEDHATRFVPPDNFFPNDLRNPKIPIISIPTTASAAEVTPGLGITNPEREKLLFWDHRLAPRLIVIDPLANVDVPASLVAATAMNGLAHCIEGLYSRSRNPISQGIALQSIGMFNTGIPAMVSSPADPAHRATVLIAAHLSGMVIAGTRTAIHHAICHCLGARGGLSHGTANSIMLPHAVSYNIPVAAGELAMVAGAMGVDTKGLKPMEAAEAAIGAIRVLQHRAGVPTRLRDVGLPREALSEIAELTFKERGLFFNPRRTTSVEPILEILQAAW